MSDTEAPAAQNEDVKDEAPKVERALGTGAREAVDGNPYKSFIPDDISPTATVAAPVVAELLEQPGTPPPGEPAQPEEHEHQVETPAPSMGEASSPA